MKNAKKSMFITTILMVAVLIVAVSTATFAWYTTNDRAGAQTVEMTSASSSSANIAVGWDKTATGTTITFVTPEDATYDPASPSAMALGQKYDATKFFTAGIAADKTFTAAGTPADVWTVSNGEEGDAAKSSFFVINYNATEAETVAINVSFSGDNADKLCMAIFNGGDLIGITRNDITKKYLVGAINAGDLSTGAEGGLQESDVALDDTITIELGKYEDNGSAHYAEISVYAWLEGGTTGDAAAGKDVSFTMSFVAQ